LKNNLNRFLYGYSRPADNNSSVTTCPTMFWSWELHTNFSHSACSEILYQYGCQMQYCSFWRPYLHLHKSVMKRQVTGVAVLRGKVGGLTIFAVFLSCLCDGLNAKMW